MSTEVRAQNTMALTSVKAIQDATERSAELLDQMEQAADDAGTTLTGIYQDAESAKVSAESANESAAIAFSQMSFVENIVGVLSLVAKHGEYEETTDTAVQPNKWYFTKEADGTYQIANGITSVYHLTADTAVDPDKNYYTRTGSGTETDPYIYTKVETPRQADLGTYYEKYYNLVGIDESIQNYVSSHMVLLNDGLWLQADNTQAKVQISTEQGNEGVIIYGVDGNPVAQYGSVSVIGNKQGFHIEIDGQEIGFYQGQTKVAFMNGSELYVVNSLAFGHFTFIERPNGHFTLKLIRTV